MTRNKSVPILITWDVDPDGWIPSEKRLQALDVAMELCHRQGISATFFFTAHLAELYDLASLQAQGHEVGCHGLTHGDEENYDRMSRDMQRRYVSEATQRLQELSGGQVRAFRSPRVKTSAATLGMLAEQGYLVDSSVCSQRVDLISSNLINTGWIFAPRRPYRPQRNNAFRAGDLPIWEVPVSALAMPFISSALRVLGLGAMKAFFRLLYAEARRTGKPIVYLAHPTECIEIRKGKKKAWKYQVKRKFLTIAYIRAHGLRLRQWLYRLDGEALRHASQELFAYMASFPDVTFVTASEYATDYLGKMT